MENVRGKTFSSLIDLRTHQRPPDGNHGHGGCAEAFERGSDHGGNSPLWVCAPDRRPRSARVAITAKVVADMLVGVGWIAC